MKQSVTWDDRGYAKQLGVARVPITLRMLAIVLFLMQTPLAASQSTGPNMDVLMPAHPAVQLGDPAILYPGPQSAWAAYNPDNSTSAYTWVMSNFSPCPHTTLQAYDWGQPVFWCYDYVAYWKTSGAFAYAGTTSVVASVSKCPDGYTLNPNQISGTGGTNDPIYDKSTCTNQLPPPPDVKSCETVGNPIYPASGMKYQVEADYQSTSGPLSYSRTYRSDLNQWLDNFQGFGIDRSVSYTASEYPGCKRLIAGGKEYCFKYMVDSAANEFLVRRRNGELIKFNTVTGLPITPGVNDRLTRIVDSNGSTIAWSRYSADDDVTERYELDGHLVSIMTRDGRVTTLTYEVLNVPTGGLPRPRVLTRVTDDTGQSLQFTYDEHWHMTTMTDPAGGVYTYRFGESTPNAAIMPVDNLTSVTYPDGTSRIYWYNEQDKTGGTNLPFALTGITDESGHRFATYMYDSQGRAISTEHAGGVEKASLVYNADGSTSVTEYNNGGSSPTMNRLYTFATVGGVKRTTGISQAGSLCASAANSTSYDANGNIVSTTDFGGTVTSRVYDLNRNLETSRTIAVGTSLARTITTTWHPTFRSPAQIESSGRRLTYAYNDKGLPTTITLTDIAASKSRSVSLGYNTLSQLVTINGPRTDVQDVTTITYHICNTGYQCGQVATITNALGQVTTFGSYNGHGQPLSITDPNGTVTTITYDLRQRVTSMQVQGETTAYEYWPTGQMKRVTLPDNTYIALTYDDAHRLIGVTDSSGNRIAYTLDNAGNTTHADVYDPSNALAFTSSAVFDGLNRLYESKGALNQTTHFAYDSKGNPLSSTDPANRTSTLSYDQLNRLVSTADPTYAVTQYGYDAKDNLTTVRDPRNLLTSYVYNGLGDLTSLISPDTGTTTSTFDNAGNTKTVTDARGQTVTYSYDALDRITQASFSDQTHSYQYDQGANGIGRLTQVTDASGSTSFTYNATGRLASKTQASSGVSKTINYGYNAAGQLTSVATPSGQAVVYLYSDGRVTGINVNGSAVLNQATYAPFGPITGWIWGNGETTSRAYDTDGRITANASAGTSTYTYNNDSSIASRTDNTPVAASLSNGLTTFAVSPNTNQLNSVTGALTYVYSYDSVGNMLSDGTRTFTYNAAGRMSSALNAGVTTTYAYNALGQRVKKSNSTGTTYFVYDEAGHLLGEYDSAGALIQELVWLDDIPVASIRANENGNGIGVFYIHTDHLNAPTKLTRSTDNAIVWRWDHDPYGNGTPNEDPDGNGLFVSLNLRYPGQYFDQETGLLYNWNRYYDPQSGRYVSSDPIGLEGGINTYAYVGGNPISFYDQYGLYGMDDVFGAVYYMTGEWDPSQGLVNFGGGLGDELTFGLTRRARDLLGIANVDVCSNAYKYGGYAGFAASLAMGYGAGTKAAAKAGSKYNGFVDFSHSLFPDAQLKNGSLLEQWLSRKGNRLNGDYVPRPMHWRMDPWYRNHFIDDAHRQMFKPFGDFRGFINRMPYVPGSGIYGAGSMVLSQDFNKCTCK
jgi:RHS repeat-associated protein